MSIIRTSLLAFSLLGLAACATSKPMADVTRFHTNPPAARGTIALLPPPVTGKESDSLAYRTQAEALQSALAQAGFTPVAEVGAAEWLVQVDFGQDSRPLSDTPSPVTIGVGAGTWGRHLGVNLGTSFGLGKGKARREVSTWLNLAILRSNDRTRVWEGRAVTRHAVTEGDSKDIGLTNRISQLARALLSGYPGPSGKTLVVKLDPPR